MYKEKILRNQDIKFLECFDGTHMGLRSENGKYSIQFDPRRTTGQWSIETPSFIKTATFEEAQEFFNAMQELVDNEI